MSERKIKELERQARLSEARRRFRRAVEYVIEEAVPEGVKAADEAEAGRAAGYLLAIRSVLEKALEEEAADYEKYGR